MVEESGLEKLSIAVPEKHFLKWLQKQSHIEELKIWIGFAEFVLALITGVILVAYVATKAPETLKYVLGFLSTVGSAAGITVGVRRYLNRNKHDED